MRRVRYSSFSLVLRRPPDPATAGNKRPARGFSASWNSACTRSRTSAPTPAASGPAQRVKEMALLERVRALLEVVGSSSFDAERRTAYQQAQRRLAELERCTGWRLPQPALLAC